MTNTKKISIAPIGLRVLPVHQVYWLYDRNPRKDAIDFEKDRSLDTLARSLLRTRWDVSLGGIIGEVSTAADRKLAMERRKEKWETLKAAAKGAGVNADPIYALQAYEDLYCTNPGTPKAALIPLGEDAVEGITCYRRSVALWRGAYLVRSNSAKKVDVKKSAYEDNENVPEVFPEDFTLPVNVFPRMSHSDRLIVQLRENNAKTEGAVKLTMKDNFIAGGELFASGDRQKAFREAFKDGTGQKIYGIYLVDTKYPEVGLKRRVLMAFGLNEDLTEYKGQIMNLANGTWSYTGDKCAVPYEKLDKVDLGMFARGAAPEKPTKLSADKYGVEEYIRIRLSDQGKRVESMTGDAMDKLKELTPFNQHKLVLETAINNNDTALKQFESIPGCRDAHLSLWYLCKHGFAVEAAKVLDTLYTKHEPIIKAAEKKERDAHLKAVADAKAAAESIGTATGVHHDPSEFGETEGSEISEGIEHAVAGEESETEAPKAPAKAPAKARGRKK